MAGLGTFEVPGHPFFLLQRHFGYLISNMMYDLMNNILDHSTVTSTLL